MPLSPAVHRGQNIGGLRSPISLLKSLQLLLIPSILHSETPAVSGLLSLALLIPGLAVSVRRLHDIGKSGWNLLWAFLPLIGIILLLVWNCRKGDAGDNDYGSDPLEGFDA